MIYSCMRRIMGKHTQPSPAPIYESRDGRKCIKSTSLVPRPQDFFFLFFVCMCVCAEAEGSWVASEIAHPPAEDHWEKKKDDRTCAVPCVFLLLLPFIAHWGIVSAALVPVLVSVAESNSGWCLTLKQQLCFECQNNTGLPQRLVKTLDIKLKTQRPVV